jgi:hypothetical protein
MNTPGLPLSKTPPYAHSRATGTDELSTISAQLRPASFAPALQLAQQRTRFDKRTYNGDHNSASIPNRHFSPCCLPPKVCVSALHKHHNTHKLVTLCTERHPLTRYMAGMLLRAEHSESGPLPASRSTRTAGRASHLVELHCAVQIKTENGPVFHFRTCPDTNLQGPIF